MERKEETRITPAAMEAAARGDIDNFFVAVTPGGIEAQEAAGQAGLTRAKNRLPQDGLEVHREELEKLGFKIGKPVDEIFLECEFPEGWKFKPTDHSMWSELVDNNEKVRGKVFYKAAFYDRKAHFTMS